MEDRGARLVRGRAERQVARFHVALGSLTALRPAHEEQRRPEAPGLVGLVVHQRIGGVGPAVGTREGRRAAVDLRIPAQRAVLNQRRRTDSFTRFPTMNATFAGRSASRRMR